MIVLKFILSSIIILCSTRVGIEISKKYVLRENELYEFKNNLEIMKNRIEYTYEPLDRVFDFIAKNSNSEVSNVFKNVALNISYNDPTSLLKEEIEKSNLSINKEDREIIISFGNNLGKTEKEGQISNINLTISLLDKQIGQAKREREKNENLYKKLGIIFGIMICVILI